MSRGAPRPGFRGQSDFLEEVLVAKQSLDGPRGNGRGGEGSHARDRDRDRGGHQPYCKGLGHAKSPGFPGNLGKILSREGGHTQIFTSHMSLGAAHGVVPVRLGVRNPL